MGILTAWFMILHYSNRKAFLKSQNQYLDKVYAISSGLQLQPQDQNITRSKWLVNEITSANYSHNAILTDASKHKQNKTNKRFLGGDLRIFG